MIGLRVFLVNAEAYRRIAQRTQRGQYIADDCRAGSLPLQVLVHHEKADERRVCVRVTIDQIHNRDQRILVKKSDIVLLRRCCARRAECQILPHTLGRCTAAAIPEVLVIARHPCVQHRHIGVRQAANCIRIGQLFNLYIFHRDLIFNLPTATLPPAVKILHPDLTEDIDFISASLFEVCFAHIALVKLGVQQVAFLEIRADEIALGKHRALDHAARKVELCQVHLGEGVVFQAAVPQALDRVSKRAVALQGQPVDVVQRAVLEIL